MVALAVQFWMTNFLNNVIDTDVDIPAPSAPFARMGELFMAVGAARASFVAVSRS
jgi:hypothetical protein